MSLEELKKELSKFYQWIDSLAKEEVTPEEEEALNEEIKKIAVDELQDIITKDTVQLDLYNEKVQNCF